MCINNNYYYITSGQRLGVFFMSIFVIKRLCDIWDNYIIIPSNIICKNRNPINKHKKILVFTVISKLKKNICVWATYLATWLVSIRIEK